MPVISVAQMHELAAAGKIDGRVVAVGGYWSQQMIPCPFAPHQSVMDGFCTGITFADSGEPPSRGIGDPSIILPREAANGNLLFTAQTSAAPGAVVLIGHAGDSRAWQCKPDDRAGCGSKFVIDRVAWINGQEQDVNSPSSDLTLAQLHLTPDQAATAALHEGDTLLTAYPLLAIDMNNVDPRFLNVGAKPPYVGAVSNPAWYVSVATGTADTDGVLTSAARVVDDASGQVLAEMPLTVAADYRPARLIFESGQDSRNEFGPNLYPRGEVNSVGTPIFADYVGLSSTPVALIAGQYVLRGFVGNQNGGGDVGDLTCDLPVTVAAEANVAFAATCFTKTSCSWAPTVSTF